MKEIKGNMWRIDADVRCITTNGFVKKNGRAVMGAGCAKEARDKLNGIDIILGSTIKNYGNHVAKIYQTRNSIYLSFPVKHHWKQIADIKLIERSAKELVILADENKEWKHILLPRPGCGNGRLEWSQVKPIIEPYLDDRFFVVYL